MTRQWHVNGIIFSIAVLLFLVSACDENNSTNLNTAESKEVIKDPLPVSYIVLEASSFNEEIISNGKIHAYRKAELHFKTQGSLVKINFRNGEWAGAGSIIASLDNRAEEIQIHSAGYKCGFGVKTITDSDVSYLSPIFSIFLLRSSPTIPTHLLNT